MNAAGTYGKIFVVDTNLFFVKRLTEALRQQGFEVVQCSESAYALTMIEWNMPVAILCGINLRNSNGFEIPAILRADVKTSHIPVIAIGDRSQQSQLEALRAGYEDFLDRRLGAEEIAAHLVSFLSSHRDGFQPTQMLERSETALDGRLSLVDLPGVLQVLAQSRQTGGLHINADSTDGIIFFDAGEITHAESGQLAGDGAVVHLVKSCYLTKEGVYKFIPGDAAMLRTVQGSLNALIMDALRELDEQERDTKTPVQTQTSPEPDGQIREAEAQEDNPPVSTAGADDTATKTETEARNWKGTETGTGAEAVPLIEAEREVSTKTGTGAGNDGPSETAEHEINLSSENDAVPFVDDRAYASIIDEATLRELNELLSNLKVEEEDSHE